MTQISQSKASVQLTIEMSWRELALPVSNCLIKFYFTYQYCSNFLLKYLVLNKTQSADKLIE